MQVTALDMMRNGTLFPQNDFPVGEEISIDVNHQDDADEIGVDEPVGVLHQADDPSLLLDLIDDDSDEE